MFLSVVTLSLLPNAISIMSLGVCTLHSSPNTLMWPPICNTTPKMFLYQNYYYSCYAQNCYNQISQEMQPLIKAEYHDDRVMLMYLLGWQGCVYLLTSTYPPSTEKIWVGCVLTSKRLGNRTCNNSCQTCIGKK